MNERTGPVKRVVADTVGVALESLFTAMDEEGVALINIWTDEPRHELRVPPSASTALDGGGKVCKCPKARTMLDNLVAAYMDAEPECDRALNSDYGGEFWLDVSSVARCLGARVSDISQREVAADPVKIDLSSAGPKAKVLDKFKWMLKGLDALGADRAIAGFSGRRGESNMDTFEVCVDDKHQSRVRPIVQGTGADGVVRSVYLDRLMEEAADEFAVHLDEHWRDQEGGRASVRIDTNSRTVEMAIVQYAKEETIVLETVYQAPPKPDASPSP